MESFYARFVFTNGKRLEEQEEQTLNVVKKLSKDATGFAAIKNDINGLNTKWGHFEQKK